MSKRGEKSGILMVGDKRKEKEKQLKAAKRKAKYKDAEIKRQKKEREKEEKQLQGGKRLRSFLREDQRQEKIKLRKV